MMWLLAAFSCLSLGCLLLDASHPVTEPSSEMKLFCQAICDNLPRELVIRIFKLSAFSGAKTFSHLDPSYGPELSRVVYKHLRMTMRKPEVKPLNRVWKHLLLTLPHLASLQGKERAVAWSTLFISSGDEVISPYLWNYLERDLTVDRKLLLRELLTDSMVPESVLSGSGNFLLDLQKWLNSCLRVGLYCNIYPLLCLLPTTTAYTIYGSILNLAMFFHITQRLRPAVFQTFKEPLLQDCFEFIKKTRKEFDQFIDLKIQEVTDALILSSCYSNRLENVRLVINEMFEDKQVGPLDQGIDKHLERVLNGGPDYLFTLLVTAMKCSPLISLDHIHGFWIRHDLNFYHSNISRITRTIDEIFGDLQHINVENWSPAFRLVIFEMIRLLKSKEDLLPLVPQLWEEGKSDENVEFLKALLGRIPDACISSLLNIFTGLHTSVPLFRRFSKAQVSVMLSLGRLKNGRLRQRVLHRLTRELCFIIDSEGPAVPKLAVYEEFMRGSVEVERLVFDSIQFCPGLLRQDAIWTLIEGIPTISTKLYKLSHQSN